MPQGINTIALPVGAACYAQQDKAIPHQWEYTLYRIVLLCSCLYVSSHNRELQGCGAKQQLWLKLMR